MLRGFAAVKRQAVDLDQALFEAIASTSSPLLDATMPRLTKAADYSKLWLGVAAGMRLTANRRLGRAAGRGLVALAVTSLVTNQVAKRFKVRVRPDVVAVPAARRAMRVPTSSSFPSGHSASAAAFAAGAGLESPAAGLLTGVLAVAVGFSRVATGAHHPSDVLVGWGLGATIAAIGGKLIPPLGPPSLVPHEPVHVEQPARPTGAGVRIVINSKSGLHAHDRTERVIREQLPDAHLATCGPDDDLVAMLAQAADEAEVLGVCGGDGTVGAAATAARRAGKPLAVFAGGTFNHFAKDLGVVNPRTTINAIQLGAAAKIDAAYLGEQLFLNTASTGVYAEFVKTRERYQKVVTKPVAMVIAALRVMREAKSVRLRWNGKERDVALLFVGNSRYEPSGFAPSMRPWLDGGLLDVRILEYRNGWQRLKVLGCILTGKLARSGAYHEMKVPRLTLESVDGPITVTRDGEVGERTQRLDLRVDYQGLTVFAPRG